MNEIIKINKNQLDEVVKGSELAIQESDEIKRSYLPFITQLAETQSQADKINFNDPTELDESIARELRLKTVKIRTGAEKLKEERKRMYLLRGNLEQAAYKVIDASCRITEEVFINVEKAREIAEKKRQEAIRTERAEKLGPYTDDAALYPLGLMKEDEFAALYHVLRTAHDNRIAAEQKAETDRIEKEKAEAKAREEQRLENIRLKAEVEEKEKQAEIERKNNAKILADQQTKALKEREKLIAEAEKERKEKERLGAEIEKKRKADQEFIFNTNQKIIAEKKAKLAEEKAAKLAPDKVKLLNLALRIEEIQRPEIKSIEAAPLMANINGLIIKLVNYIRENADKL